MLDAVGLWDRLKKFTECPIYRFGLLEGCEMTTVRNDLKAGVRN